MVIVSSTKVIERAQTATSSRDAVNNASVITSTDSTAAVSTVIVPPSRKRSPRPCAPYAPTPVR